MKCRICEENEAYITARKSNGDLVDCCKLCLDASRNTDKPLHVACVWKKEDEK